MKSDIKFFMELVVSFLPFILFAFLNGKANVKKEVKILDNDKFSFATWHWGPTTSAMMRKSVCEMLLLIDRAKAIKITADKFMFSFYQFL